MTRFQPFFALSASLSLLYGCGTILGLNEYEIDESRGGDGDGDADGDGDSGGTGGTSGDGDGDDTGGRTGSGGRSNMGGMGSGGAPLSCDGIDCDDNNDCTSETCINDECGFTTRQAGQPCDGGVCNGITGNAACVRCVDDATALLLDSGCDDARPICDERGTPTCVQCRDHADCDDENDCTADTCDAGTCEYLEQPVGDACLGGVCGGDPGTIACVRCVDDASGDSRDTGCTPGAPRCEDAGELTCVGCDDDEDCNDENDCTDDSCDALAQCVYDTVAEAASCTGGICNGTEGSEACVDCVDDANGGNQDTGCALAQPICDTAGTNTCRICVDDATGAARDTGCTAGLPVCDTASGYSCVVCANDKGPGSQDSGCSITDPFCVAGGCVACEGPSDCGEATPICSDGSCVQCDESSDCGGATPYCNGAGTCVACLNASHCADSVGCTDDACNAGTCQHIENDANCPSSGDACSPNVCDAVNGCEQVSLTLTEIQLAQDLSFEGSGVWQEYSEVGAPLILSPSHFAARTGTNAAWLCGTANEYSDVYQWVTIPPDAIDFTVSGYYRVHFQNDFEDGNMADADDFLLGLFYDIDINPLGTVADRYLDLTGATESPSWIYFEQTYTNIAAFNPGELIQFDFWCETDQNPGDTAFYIDDVSLVARVCQP